MSAPRVSVLLPVYNGSRHLAAAIRGILAQTFADFELLVLDDGSTDHSAAIAAGFGDPRLRVLANDTNLGLARTLNRGLAEARGRWVARQDADDLSKPRRLELQLAYLEQHLDVALLGTQGRLVDEAGRVIRPIERPCEPASVRWWQIFDNSFLHTSVVFDRAVVQDLGGYEASVGRSQDYELWSRVVRQRPAANLADCLVSYRTHAASSTATLSPMDARQRQTIIAANVAAALGEGALEDGDVQLLYAFRFGVTPEQAAPFLSLLDSLLASYLRLYPEARSSLDFWRTVARQYTLLLPSVLGAARRGRGARAAHLYTLGLGASPLLPSLVGLEVARRALGRARRRT